MTTEKVTLGLPEGAAVASGSGLGTSVHMSCMDHPLKYIVLDQLISLVTEAARQPELLYVATTALAEEMHRLGMTGKELKKVRETAEGLRHTVGCSADGAWKKLDRVERFRNRKREKGWKREHTEGLLAEGQCRVAAILEDR